VLDTESGVWIPAFARMTEEKVMTQIADLVVKIPLEFYDTNQRFGRKILKGKLMEFRNFAYIKIL